MKKDELAAIIPEHVQLVGTPQRQIIIIFEQGNANYVKRNLPDEYQGLQFHMLQIVNPVL